MLIGDTLRLSAQRLPDKIAVVGRGRQLTFAELDRSADQLANALLGLCLDKAAKVAILSTNRPEYAIAYYAIARTGYVSVHCSTRSTADEIAYVLSKTEADVVLTEAEYLGLIGDAQSRLGKKIRLILFDAVTSDDRHGLDANTVDQFVDGFSTAGAPAVELDEKDHLAITLTGGTTGLPKAVLVSHRARSATANAAVDGFGLHEDDVLLASTPLFHTVGLFVWFGTGILLGTTIVLPDAWSPVEFMDIVRREKITAAFLVPSQLNALISHADFSTAPLATLRHIGYAGAPMSRALFKRVAAALPHVEFTENYGQSEACPLTIRRKDHGEAKLGTVGKPVPNTEIAIVGQSGEFLSAGEVGDVAVRGDTVFDEYYNDAEETAAAFRLGNGWLLTGDVGFLDGDGFLTLVDRSKDMLISGGENIYPTEIENVLYQHQAVNECAVFGIPDDTWGEVPAAYVVLAEGATVSDNELIEFCAQRTARYKRPKLVRFVDSLPKTTVGKIRKNVLRDSYWKGREKKI